MEILKSIYEDVREWLKFAETKNAALLTFNGVIVFGIFDKVVDKASDSFIKTALIMGCAIILISIIINLVSFLPQFNTSSKIQNNVVNGSQANGNLMFYEVIKDFNPQAYLDTVAGKYNLASNEKNIDLATQIVTLSQITHVKLKYFNLGLYFTFSGILIPIVSVIIVFFKSI
ncbi:DUF5706 domain-containing protein [Bacillus thuringiensis]|uniref:DUF5706 domain-containing protein n=1 Tax=Bacillus thuringiensis TaxID=1428 RepID=A0AAW9GDU0_BACTU|nr:Pycsar system effector family protein [Bacillus thuringiensis]MDY0850434.1 DUF5706 domain-containing protein [Bacillus thuringiensis]MDY4389209.1 DUF5706 domain-containing protein [Bacillus thuringiensis]